MSFYNIEELRRMYALSDTAFELEAEPIFKKSLLEEFVSAETENRPTFVPVSVRLEYLACLNCFLWKVSTAVQA